MYDHARSERQMVNAGIQDGALLLVDCSLTPKHDDIVIASIDGQMTCKFIDTKLHALRSANPHFEPIPIKEGNQVEVVDAVIIVVNIAADRSHTAFILRRTFEYTLG